MSLCNLCQTNAPNPPHITTFLGWFKTALNRKRCFTSRVGAEMAKTGASVISPERFCRISPMVLTCRSPSPQYFVPELAGSAGRRYILCPSQQCSYVYKTNLSTSHTSNESRDHVPILNYFETHFDSSRTLYVNFVTLKLFPVDGREGRRGPKT